LLFDTPELAERFCAQIGGKPIAYSGWHVYNNMEQVLGKVTGAEANCPYNCPRFPAEREYRKHMLPQTDFNTGRAVNISVGVVDKGLGSGYGININSAPEEIRRVGEALRAIILAL